MAPGDILVRTIDPADRADWFDMWNAYCAFYEATMPERVTAHTWEQIVAADSPVRAVIAEDAAGRAVGFVNYVVHPYTWSDRPCCYLEDLFVRPEFRGAGAGRALIEWLLARCKENDWTRLYWLTKENNVAARRLYDRFTARDEFVRYALKLGD